MKYEDDELAEAALLLAHQSELQKMPADLEKRIEAQGRAAVGTSRPQVTTTRGAAVAIEAEPRRIEPRGRLREWAPWLIAAACFALVVYQWRLSSLHQGARSTASATAAVETPLKDGAGRVVALVRWQTLGAEGELRVVSGLPGPAGERYRVFATETDPARAVSLAEFRCADECSGKRVVLPTTPRWGKGRLLLTRHPSELPTWTGETTVLAEGTWPSDATAR